MIKKVSRGSQRVVRNHTASMETLYLTVARTRWEPRDNLKVTIYVVIGLSQGCQ